MKLSEEIYNKLYKNNYPENLTDLDYVDKLIPKIKELEDLNNEMLTALIEDEKLIDIIKKQMKSVKVDITSIEEMQQERIKLIKKYKELL